MNRNTKIFIIGLSIFATIVTGVNLANMLNTNQTADLPTTDQTQVSVTPIPTHIPRQFISDTCNISFWYNGDYNRVDIDNGGSTLSNSDGESLTLLCQTNLPRPLDIQSSDSIQKYGSISATLIEPVASGSSTTRGRLFFRHPGNKKNVSISGTAKIFQQVKDTLSTY